MSEAGPSAAAPAFSARAVLALIVVGVVAFAGLAVLSAYAPDLRAGQDGRAHALSKSAVGFAGAPILMQHLGRRVIVSRVRPSNVKDVAVVLTPEGSEKANAVAPFADAGAVLLIMPKWQAAPDPLRKGFVRKIGPLRAGDRSMPVLSGYSKQTRTALRNGVSRPVLRGVGGGFAEGPYRKLGPIDRLQTVSGEGWAPALVDETGGAVLAYSIKNPRVLLLADPDLLNNQGIANADTARAGAGILDVLSGQGRRTLLFDVTLNGLERGRGLGRLMLEPPWLAATLIAVAAGVLMGLHALARFGQPRAKGRAFALGARALVDNSADLVRVARKEHELAPAYAALTQALVARAAGGHAEPGWLEELARRRGVAEPGELAAEAGQARSRDDLLAVARKLYEWRGEMTRERR